MTLDEVIRCPLDGAQSVLGLPCKQFQYQRSTQMLTCEVGGERATPGVVPSNSNHSQAEMSVYAIMQALVSKRMGLLDI